jgi:hypothetical protein
MLVRGGYCRERGLFGSVTAGAHVLLTRRSHGSHHGTGDKPACSPRAGGPLVPRVRQRPAVADMRRNITSMASSVLQHPEAGWRAWVAPRPAWPRTGYISRWCGNPPRLRLLRRPRPRRLPLPLRPRYLRPDRADPEETHFPFPGPPAPVP